MDYILEALTNVESNREEIPDSCLSFSEMSDYISSYSYEELFTLIESIGVDELAMFEESCSVMLYEGNNLVELRAKFTNQLNKVYATIKSFWEKVIARFSSKDEIVKDFKKADLSKIPEGKSFGKVHKFEKLGATDYASNAIKMSEQTRKVFEGLVDNNASAEQIKAAVEKLEDSICSVVSGTESNSISEVKKAVRDKLIGDVITVDADWVKSNKDSIISAIDSKSIVREIKADYNKEKQAFKEISTDINKIDNSLSSVAVQWARIITDITNVMHACYAVEMDVLKRQSVEYKSVALKVIKAAK